MKYVKKGNVYRRVSWLKEHEELVWTCLYVFVFYAAIAVTLVVWG